jgi:hypothetical protein
MYASQPIQGEKSVSGATKLNENFATFLTNDEANDLVIAVASTHRELSEIAKRLQLRATWVRRDC